jgi:hypothetical protein
MRRSRIALHSLDSSPWATFTLGAHLNTVANFGTETGFESLHPQPMLGGTGENL